MIFLVIALAVILLIIIPGVRIINQYERGVVLRLGKFSRMLTPGFRVIIPYIDHMTKVDVRTTPMDIPKQEVITRDNVTVNVDAIVYFRVIDAPKAVLETTNYAMLPALLLKLRCATSPVISILTKSSASAMRSQRKSAKSWTHKPTSGVSTSKA